MPEHADDSPTGSENLAQVVESEQATRFEAALHKVQALVGVGPTAHDQVVTDGQEWSCRTDGDPESRRPASPPRLLLSAPGETGGKEYLQPSANCNLYPRLIATFRFANNRTDCNYDDVPHPLKLCTIDAWLVQILSGVRDSWLCGIGLGARVSVLGRAIGFSRLRVTCRRDLIILQKGILGPEFQKGTDSPEKTRSG